MSLALLTGLGLALLVGLSLGLLGGGGSILTVPILTYVVGLPPREAIAASLFVVAVTSAISVVGHARAGRVRWRTGLLFGAAGMLGAFLGGLLGGWIPGRVLMLAFALMMVATSLAMLRGRRSSDSAAGSESASVPKVLGEGLAVGLVTGLVGAGGGFLVVPALVLLGGLSMGQAVGTSLVVIALKSFAGLSGYLTAVSLDWAVVGSFTALAVVGSLVGARMAGRIPEAALRQGFGVFVLVMGVVVLAQEVPAPWGSVVVGGAAAAALTATACWGLIPSCPLRRAAVAG